MIDGGGAEVHGKNSIAPEMQEKDLPTAIFGKSYPTNWYSDIVVQFPTVFLFVYSLVPIIFTFLSLTYDTTVDKGISSFEIRDHPTAQAMRLMESAPREWLGEVEASKKTVGVLPSSSTVSTVRGEVSYRLFVNYEIDLAKLSSSDNASSLNLLTPDAIDYMHRIETKISNLANHKLLCWRPSFRGEANDGAQYALPHCAPFTSLLTYYFVGLMQNSSSTAVPYWQLDGISGTMQVPFEDVLNLVFANSRYRWFMDQSASGTKRSTTLLRTQITLGAPVVDDGNNRVSDVREEQLVDAFVDEFIELMENPDPHSSISITFGGDRIQEVLVLNALARDTVFIVLSIVLVFFVLWFHFHSFVLALFGTLQIILIYPAGFFLFLAITGERKVTLLNTLAFYVTLVIATDAQMIVFDTFKHSGFMATTGRRNMLSISQRVAYTFRKAGVGVTVSSLVAVCCFAVNTASLIPAISQFSITMVILVILNYLLTMSYFPAAMLFHHFHISKRRRNLQRQKEILIARGERRRDASMVLFLKQLEDLNVKHGKATFAEIKTYMEGELFEENEKRAQRQGVWQKLDIVQPVRVANPFSRKTRAATVADVDAPATTEENAEEGLDPQAFLDQFADARPNQGSGAEVITSDRHNIDPAAVLRISNINCDELCGFDDTRLRFKLVECGARNPADFRDDQLLDLAPDMGVKAMGPKAEARVPSFVRMGIVLMYGDGRTLHRPPPLVVTEEGSAPREQEETAAAPINAEGDAMSPKEEADANASPADEPHPADLQEQPKNKRFGFMKRISNWWEERRSVERKWCCGMVGQRVGETKEEQEARILAKKVKHEGYSRLELLFFNYWAPGVNFARYALVAVLILLLVAGAVLSVFLKPALSAPNLLGDNPSEDYDQVAQRFGETGPCDYCSAYFQPASTFPTPDPGVVLQCSAFKYKSQMMFSWLDQCGECHGNNDCLDCSGTIGGSKEIDSCKQCLDPLDAAFGKCQRCTSHSQSLNCSFCHYDTGAPVGFNGPNCSTFCDETVCPPHQGKCNPFTGKCDCHRSYSMGFWDNDPNSTPSLTSSLVYCSICLAGFSGSDCKVECASSGRPCSCDNITRRCTGCLAGLGGSQCTTRIHEYCHTENGYVTPLDGCVCLSGWDPRSNCHTSTACSGNGVIYSPGQAHPAVTGCQCNGQWRGANCDYCRCFNGGTCDRSGKCHCVGGWTGLDCQQCPETCISNGLCALSYEAQHYSIKQCHAVNCIDREIDTFTKALPLCNSCRRLNTTNCTAISGFSSCSSADKCEWDWFLKECVSSLPQVPAPSNTENCTCKGRWQGPRCDICDTTGAPTGVSCNENGILVGCDGRPAANGVYKVTDVCGNCGGDDLCIGCDGIRGSTKILDACGVCGGFNECPSQAQGGFLVDVTTEIHLMFGLNLDGTPIAHFDITDPTLQSHLEWICTQLTQRDDIVKPSQSTCVFIDLVRYIRTTYFIFPYTNPDFHQIAFDWAQRTGRTSEIGFTSTDRSTAKVEWLKFTFRSANMKTRAELSDQAEGIRLWNIIMRNINNPNTRGNHMGDCIFASPAWVSIFTQRAAREGTIFSMVVGGLVFLTVTLATSCSPTILALAAVTISSDVLVVLGMFFVVGWDLGPVEMISMSLLMGIGSEQITHMVEGYLEYLHATQSHMFARDTTRLQAVRGMYQRTGVSILSSGLTIIVASLLLYAAKILVFRRVASVMIIVVVTNLVHALVFFGAALCTIGPTTSFRNKKTIAIFLGIGLPIATVIFLILFFTEAIVLL